MANFRIRFTISLFLSLSLSILKCLQLSANTFKEAVKLRSIFLFPAKALSSIKLVIVEAGIAKLVACLKIAFAELIPIISYPEGAFAAFTRRGPPEFPESIGAEC